MSLPIDIYNNIDFLDKRNVVDKYKGKTNEFIKEDLKTQSLPFAVLMFNLQQDFNLASVIRSSNALGAEKVFYFGEKKWDRRGATGAHHYIEVERIKCLKELWDLKKEYSFVALEQCSTSIDIRKFNWKTQKKPLIILGEEGCGLSEDTIKLCDFAIEIPQRGSIRSVNAAVAASIAMYDFVNKFEEA